MSRPNSPDYYVPGAYTDNLEQSLRNASGSEVVALLSGSGLIPEHMKDGRLLPVLIYGAEPYRVEHPSGGHQGIADLMPASGDHLATTISDDYFNPHGQLKKVAHAARITAPNTVRVRDDDHRGSRFYDAGYVLDTRRSGRVLFTDETDSAKEELLGPLAEVYEIGTIAVGNQVLFGPNYLRLPKPGLPAIIREIGQTIFHLPYKEGAKIALIKEVVKDLERNRSPHYAQLPKKKRQAA